MMLALVTNFGEIPNHLTPEGFSCSTVVPRVMAAFMALGSAVSKKDKYHNAKHWCNIQSLS